MHTGFLVIVLYTRSGSWLNLFPGLAAISYFVVAFGLIRESHVKLRYYFLSVLTAIPFWIYSYFEAHRIYSGLPDKAPQGCFVVTAAARGHRQIVGPFYETEHDGVLVLANLQLITLWEFERRWQKNFPYTHRLFRKIYNHIGPRVAARIHSPMLADVVYVLLKPVEWIASVCALMAH